MFLDHGWAVIKQFDVTCNLVQFIIQLLWLSPPCHHLFRNDGISGMMAYLLMPTISGHPTALTLDICLLLSWERITHSFDV